MMNYEVKSKEFSETRGQESVFRLLSSAVSIHNSSFSPSVIHHSSFIIHHSSFIIHHSSFIIHHSSFVIFFLSPKS